MTVVPLGTSSAVPTRTRHLPSTALVIGGRTFMFDCGEGTQQRMVLAGLKQSRVTAVFITHVHGDHYFGLLGLLSSMSLARRSAPLTLVAPEELIRIMDLIPGVRTDELTFPVHHVALRVGQSYARVYEANDFVVEARALDHRVHTVGYRAQERVKPGLDVDRARALGITDYRDYQALKNGQSVLGANGKEVAPDMVLKPLPEPRTFAYVTDTRPCEAGELLGRNATLMIHEATFMEDLAERADESGHSTAAQAADVAKRARAQRLLLTHFSSRYNDTAPLVAEAQAVFPATEAAEELRHYRLAQPVVVV